MTKKAKCSYFLTAALLLSGCASKPDNSVNLTMGLPATAKDSQTLFDQLDYQRACQCYLWALPVVSFAQWQDQHEHVFGATDTDLVLYTTYQDKLGILTANATTPYVLNFPNLAR